MDNSSSGDRAEIFDLCNAELFPEPLQNSEVTSSNYCSYEENSHNKNLTFPQETDTKFTNTVATTAFMDPNNYQSLIYYSQDEADNDISASIDFSVQYDFSSMQSDMNSMSQYCSDQAPAPVMGDPTAVICEEECLSNVSGFVPLNQTLGNCDLLGSGRGGYNMGEFCTQVFGGNLMVGNELQLHENLMVENELQLHELEFQGDNNGGIFCNDHLQTVLSSAEYQALRNETQLVGVGVGMGAEADCTPLTSAISVLDDSTFRVGKLSVEQRKEKIHRYMKKRNERNFTKKIKYACRKTLADSRPRVRGRFAKNDEFGDNNRPSCSHHQEDDDDQAVLREEMVNSCDIFAHISGVNFFKCNYPIQSWI